MIDSAGFLWSYVIELRECKARSNELVDPCTICVYIVAIWCSAAYIQGAVRSQAVIYAANIDPSGSHVAFRIEIVPFSICFLPLGCRVGTIWILPPPADAVSSFLPAFWEGVGIIVIGSVGAWGPGAEDTHLLFALLLAFTERTLKVYLEPALTQLEKS